MSEKPLHVYNHLQLSRTCHDSCSAETFTILDSATSSFQVKIKEALYMYMKLGQNYCSRQYCALSVALSSRFITIIIL